MAGPQNLVRREVCYRGRVQGVGFRYTARQIASRYRVTGYVCNLRDGRVELVVEGPPEEVDRFLAAVSSTMGRYIEDVDQTEGPATGEFRGFGCRY